jgi:hypothetical protein
MDGIFIALSFDNTPIFAEDQAVEVIYKSCHVIAVPELNLDADCWIPKADVSWVDHGIPRHQLITGLNDYFKIIDEAETNAVEIAKAWIDAVLLDDHAR